MIRVLFLLFLFFSIQISICKAQTDSLIFENGDKMVGELKNMEYGVIVMKTNYSDSDFKIEWDGIDQIFSSTLFLITISDGTRYIGYLFSMPDKRIRITDEYGIIFYENIDDIVFLKSLELGILSRVSASIDLSLSVIKANNLTQLNTRNTLGYVAKRWSIDTYYNTLVSVQDSVSDTKRIDSNINYRWFLPNDWYLPANATFLSNNEQNLRLRVIGSLGVGKYLIHQNTFYWGINIGISFVQERFTTSDPDQQSWEGYAGMELNLFDIKDIKLQTILFVYPGLTEQGRLRSDFSFDLKYDLPKDFYFRLGLSLNYDSRPIEGGSQTDYVFTTGFGWEW
ncbi:DUF481 domain-containing protein [Sediminitomix flava]|uniref:Uncharacterized protein DUF481 n=1 Tax=Sediminitomix flava TaxID=379075 RepID=A0A315ZEA2_SEDFL|nr:DUF481 domain-containing protein [Sediminitomix flava]PWJ43895.1 uncharacterized protein DUF481 [Sediminitomix flava]